jgi:hypothetical protein
MRFLSRDELTDALEPTSAGHDALVPVPAAAARVQVKLRTLRSWIRHELVGVTTVKGRQCVLVSEVADVEAKLRTANRGRPRR